MADHSQRAPGPGTVLDGRYELLRLLGEGGFGIVYEARQRSTGQRVAVKLLRRERLEAARDAGLEVERFRRELEAIARLRHPNIVQLIDQGHTASGDLYAVLGFIEGASLNEVLRSEGALALDEACHVMGQVLDALGYAHAQGIVHRDLKPHNIMLTTGAGRLRHALVVDFGIATLAGPGDAGRTQLTGDGQFPGTPAYMAPEQLRAEPITPAVDLYAWGLSFLEALSGRPVFEGASVAAIIFRQMVEDAVPIPGSVRESPLGHVLARATAKDPARRYRSAREALFDLEAATREADPSSAIAVVDGGTTGDGPIWFDAVTDDGALDRRAGLAGTLDELPTEAIPERLVGLAGTLDALPVAIAPEHQAALAGTLDALPAEAGDLLLDGPATRLDLAPVPGAPAHLEPPPPPASAAADTAPAPRRAWLVLALAILATLAVAGGLAVIWALQSGHDDTDRRDDGEPTQLAHARDEPEAEPLDTGASDLDGDDPATAASPADAADATEAPAPPERAAPPDPKPLLRSAALGAGATLWPTPPLQVRSVALSKWTSCALLSDGRVRCWGDGRRGGLGAGRADEAYGPVELEGLPPLVALHAGAGTELSFERGIFCGTTADGAVWCWGDNTWGGLGSGGRDESATPRRVPSLRGLTKLVRRGQHACALLDAELACWGVDNQGVLGQGAMGGEVYAPALVTEPSSGALARPLRDVAVTGSASCALDDAGATWCWGYTHGSLLGRGVTTSQARPIQVVEAPPFRALAASASAVCGLERERDAVSCWGFGLDGPTPIADTAGLLSLVAGEDEMCGLDAAGGVRCWSLALLGERRALPRELGAPVASLAMGIAHTCAVLEGGHEVRCLGRNDRGQLGDGSAVDRTEAVAVAHLLDDPLPPAPPTPSAVPEHESAFPTPPPDLPADCIADPELEVEARRDREATRLAVRSTWLHRHPQGRYELLVADYRMDPTALEAAPRGTQQRIVVSLPLEAAEANAPVPSVWTKQDAGVQVRLERGIDDSGHLALGRTFDGQLELTHVGEDWICGNIAVATPRGARVTGRFVAARTSARR